MRLAHAGGPVLALVALLATALASPPAGARSPPQDIAVIAWQIDDLMTLDPAEAYEISAGEVISNLYDRLIRVDSVDAGHPVETTPGDRMGPFKGDLAETVRVSPDGRVFTVTLRADARFASGAPVTAADAAWSLARVVRLGRGPAGLLNALGLTAGSVDARVRAEGERTLVIETDRTLAPGFVLNVLSSWVGSVVDRNAATAAATGKDDLANGFLRRASAGSGPFRLGVWRPNEAVILDRDPGHWRGPARSRRVVLRHVPEPGTQRLLLVKGEVDAARNIGPDDLAALAADPALRIRWRRLPTLYYLGLNQKNPVLARPEVIEAFKWLVDYQSLSRDVLKGTKVVHQSILPVGMPGAIAETPYGYNLARARALLAAAGVPEGFAVTMDTRNSAPTLDIAQALQALWAPAGIRLEILPGDNKQTLTRYRARRHDIHIGTWAADHLDPHTNAEAFAFNPDNGDLAPSRTLAWRNGWQDPAASAAVMAALTEADPGRRLDRYADLQRRLQRTAPYVILFQERAPVVEQVALEGYDFGATFDAVSYARLGKR